MGNLPYGAFIGEGVAILGFALLILSVTGAVRIPISYYRILLFLTLAALVAFMMSSGSVGGPDISTVLGKLVGFIFDFLIATPFVLLVEAGAFGYLGFKGRWR